MDGDEDVEELFGGLGVGVRFMVSERLRPSTHLQIRQDDPLTPIPPSLLRPRFILSFLERIGGHKRHFSLTDISIQHPLVSPETVGPGLLLIISFLLPLLFTLLISLFIYRSKWDAHNSTLGVFTSFTITGVVTQIIKMGVGRPRPHTISVCQPAPGARDAPVWGLSDWTICTTEDRLALDDTFKSFPSGHSSLSFAGMGFLSWYIMGKLHVGDRRGYRVSPGGRATNVEAQRWVGRLMGWDVVR